jgi:hypothetical protein
MSEMPSAIETNLNFLPFSRLNCVYVVGDIDAPEKRHCAFGYEPYIGHSLTNSMIRTNPPRAATAMERSRLLPDSAVVITLGRLRLSVVRALLVGLLAYRVFFINTSRLL